MSTQVELLDIYFGILKIIYEHKDGVTSSVFINRLGIDKKRFSAYILQLQDSSFAKYIHVDKSRKTHIYKPALSSLDEVIKYYSGYNYTYDEFLAMNSFHIRLDDKNKNEIMKQFQANFVAIDNPLQDYELSNLEFSHINTFLKAQMEQKRVDVFLIEECIYNAIFLKIIYSDKNWYALIKDENKIELKRIAFIKQINIKGAKYNKSSIPENLDRKIRNLTNSLSLYDTPTQTAVLQISPKVQKYFEANMKKFFKSQKIIQTNPFLIEIEYTQDLEILRFVKTWLPDIKIISPISLKQAYKENLQTALSELD